MGEDSVVYLACVGSKRSRSGYIKLDEILWHLGESGLTAGSKDLTWCTCSARGDRCVLEWVATSRESPFANGSRELVLGHGETVQVGEVTYVAYVERADATCDRQSPERPSYNAADLAILDGLTDDQRRTTVERFLHLPYTREAWSEEFSSATEFVQCKDGKVPGVRSTHLTEKDGILQLRFDVAVFNVFRGEWLPDPSTELVWRLQAYDLEMLRACATFLSILPVPLHLPRQ